MAKWIRPLVGSKEFLNGGERYCLWLRGAAPAELRAIHPIMERVEHVRRFRLASSAAPTRAAADRPMEFFYVNQPTSDYILIPEVSSERRRYIPIGWMPANVVSTNTNFLVQEPSLFWFGVLHSAMHMAWVNTVAGRLKSDYRYSGSMVYNTFPWPEDVPGVKRAAIESCAQAVLETRQQFPDSSMADLYDPLAMPQGLLKAHANLDSAVDVAYGRKKFAGNADRVAFLFERYAELTQNPGR